jgi:hypothetical protein
VWGGGGGGGGGSCPPQKNRSWTNLERVTFEICKIMVENARNIKFCEEF